MSPSSGWYDKGMNLFPICKGNQGPFRNPEQYRQASGQIPVIRFADFRVKKSRVAVLSLTLPHELQPCIGLRPHGRPAGGNRPARERHHARLEAQHPARRHRLGQDLYRGERHRAARPPDAGPQPQQDPRGTALRRIQELLPRECRRVLRLLLRLLPAGGLPALDGHLYRKGPFHQRRNREDASEHRRNTSLGAPRRHRRLERLVPLRLRQPGRLPCHGHQHPRGAGCELQALPLQAGRGTLHAHRTGARTRHVPRQR